MSRVKTFNKGWVIVMWVLAFLLHSIPLTMVSCSVGFYWWMEGEL